MIRRKKCPKCGGKAVYLSKTVPDPEFEDESCIMSQWICMKCGWKSKPEYTQI